MATRLGGSGGYEPGTIDVRREHDLSGADLAHIDAALAGASFDTIAPRGEVGHDGAQWILERSKNGTYRLVERWSPRNDPKQVAFVSACEVFLELAGHDIVTGDVY